MPRPVLFAVMHRHEPLANPPHAFVRHWVLALAGDYEMAPPATRLLTFGDGAFPDVLTFGVEQQSRLLSGSLAAALRRGVLHAVGHAVLAVEVVQCHQELFGIPLRVAECRVRLGRVALMPHTHRRSTPTRIHIPLEFRPVTPACPRRAFLTPSSAADRPVLARRMLPPRAGVALSWSRPPVLPPCLVARQAQPIQLVSSHGVTLRLQPPDGDDLVAVQSRELQLFFGMLWQNFATFPWDRPFTRITEAVTAQFAENRDRFAAPDIYAEDRFLHFLIQRWFVAYLAFSNMMRIAFAAPAFLSATLSERLYPLPRLGCLQSPYVCVLGAYSRRFGPTWTVRLAAVDLAFVGGRVYAALFCAEPLVGVCQFGLGRVQLQLRVFVGCVPAGQPRRHPNHLVRSFKPPRGRLGHPFGGRLGLALSYGVLRPSGAPWATRRGRYRAIGARYKTWPSWSCRLS